MSALAEYLAEQQRVWVRVGAGRLDGDWQLSLLEVTVEEAPPSWHRGRWSYERAVFVASKLAGATVAKWLERGRISLPSLSIKTALDGSVSLERRDSNFQGIYEQLPWPVREWIVRFHDSSGQMVHDELVAVDSPAFISFDRAAAAFFGAPLKPNRNFSGREIVVRQQDRRARIDRVRVHPTELVIDVSGKQLRGASLTFGGFDGASRALSPHTRELARLSAPLDILFHQPRLEADLQAPSQETQDEAELILRLLRLTPSRDIPLARLSGPRRSAAARLTATSATSVHEGFIAASDHLRFSQFLFDPTHYMANHVEPRPWHLQPQA